MENNEILRLAVVHSFLVIDSTPGWMDGWDWIGVVVLILIDSFLLWASRMDVSIYLGVIMI